jgi:glycine cleavage system protein P-like pyridoxal-binding family
MGRAAFEMILNVVHLKKRNWVTDIIKAVDGLRISPAGSFPVAGTLMIEPTESENLEELDRLWRYDFYQKEIETATLDNSNNILKKCTSYFNDGYGWQLDLSIHSWTSSFPIGLCFEQ